MSKLSFSDDVRTAQGPKAPWLAIAGGALMLISGLLSWSYDERVLGNIAVRFYPAGIQLYAMMFGVLAVILGVLLLRRPPWMSPARGLRILGITALVFLVWVLGSIAYQTSGLINLNEGGWVALVGAVLITVAGHLSPDVDIDVRTWPKLSSTVEIIIIVVLMAVLLFTVAYTLNIRTASSSPPSWWRSSGWWAASSEPASAATSASSPRTTVDRCCSPRSSWPSSSRSRRTGPTPTCRSRRRS